jgi:ligand-binding sensor domain-containing protein
MFFKALHDFTGGSYFSGSNHETDNREKTMISKSFGIVLVAVLAVCAAGGKGKQSGEARADSVVYDQPTEWRLFSIDAPIHAIALQGTLLWCATESEVATINTKGGKKVDVQKIKALGTMPAAGITAMAIDKQGGVWFGGPNGAAVKSGAQYTVFTSENGLSDNKVTAFAVAADGAVWAGTENGVNQYLAGTWKQFTTKEGLVSNKIQAMCFDGKGALWIGTDKGISVFDGLKWKSYTIKDGMSWNNTKALAYDRRKETVWAVVGEKDVNSFDGEKWNVYMDIQQGIVSIMVDSQSRIWFGTGTGLIKFNGDDWINDPKQLGVPATQAYQVLCDEKGNMWFAMENGVVYRANPYPF